MDDLFEALNLSLTGDNRMKRIRRASTSGNKPLLRRYFSPYFYYPSSGVPDFFSTECLEGSLVDEALDLLIPDLQSIPECSDNIAIVSGLKLFIIIL